MRTKLALAMAIIAPIGVLGCTNHHSRQVRVYVSASDPVAAALSYEFGTFGEPPLSPKMDWATDFWSLCGGLAFATSRMQADYILAAGWVQNRWLGTVQRRDSALVYRGESSDYKQLLKAGCEAVKNDQANWPFTAEETDREFAATVQRTQESAAERYDLRDLHNGPKTTTAIPDKRTGKVWIWTEITDENGKSTGKSAFVAEDVVGSPSAPN